MPPPADSPELAAAALPKRISWAQHRAWLDHNWHRGQHVSIIAATGDGKSYLVREGLLPLWADYRVLILDVKGDDETLAGLGQLVHSFPAVEDNPQQQPPAGERVYRLLVPEFEWSPRSGSKRRDSPGLRRAQEVAGTALHRCYQQGDWLIVLDEARAIVDNEQAFGLGLRGVVENIWQRGRSRGVALVSCTQQPLWMPSSFYSQPSVLYIARMLEPPTNRLREIGGDTQLMRRTLPKLARYEFLVVERGGRTGIVKVGA
jgi:hypothetical protein